jgi:glycerate dehydrogenase
MKMVVLDGYTLNPGDLSWGELERLGELVVYDRSPAAEVAERARAADILLANKAPVSAETIADAGNLKFITVLATGYDVVDVAAAGQRGIPVANVPEYGTDSVAQFAVALVLELAHQVGRHNTSVKAGEWSACPDWCYWKTRQVLLAGKKMGIVGFGRIGRRVGELAHALGMDVLAHDTVEMPAPDYRPFSWKTLPELFAEADVVTLHCPQTSENVGFADRELFGLMKKEAFFVNASRGGLVQEKDLAEALNAGDIAGAAVDVVSREPIQPDNPLLSARNCIITPHMAWASWDARRNLMETTVANIKAFLAGRPINVVNREFLAQTG